MMDSKSQYLYGYTEDEGLGFFPMPAVSTVLPRTLDEMDVVELGNEGETWAETLADYNESHTLPFWLQPDYVWRQFKNSLNYPRAWLTYGGIAAGAGLAIYLLTNNK